MRTGPITAAAAAALLTSTMAFAVGGGGQGEAPHSQRMHPARGIRSLAADAGQPDELAGSPRDVTEGGPQNTATRTPNRDRNARAQRRSDEPGS
ncbi:MAG: hypothetical protein ACJ8EL_19760 [Rhizomicrobium sp.]|jgi:hypothetical protein